MISNVKYQHYRFADNGLRVLCLHVVGPTLNSASIDEGMIAVCNAAREVLVTAMKQSNAEALASNTDAPVLSAFCQVLDQDGGLIEVTLSVTPTVVTDLLNLELPDDQQVH
jgi:uncharacterized protein YejL (UPF0352 family)